MKTSVGQDAPKHETQPPPTIRRAVDVFFEKFTFDARMDRTERAYRSGARAFLEFLAAQERLSPESPLAALDSSLLSEFDRWMQGAEHLGPGPRAGDPQEKRRTGYSPATRRLYTAALKRMLGYWWHRDWLPFSQEEVDGARKATQVQSRRKPRAVSSRSSSVPTDFGDRMLAAAEALPYPGESEAFAAEGDIADPVALRLAQLRVLRARAVVHVARATALRVSDLMRLDRTHVRLAEQANGHLQIAMQKTGHTAYVYFGEAALAAVTAYLELRGDPSPWIFIQHGRTGRPGAKASPSASQYEQAEGRRGYGYPLGEGTLRAIVVKLAKAAGYKPGPKEFISIHAFRHWHAQRLIEEGASIDQVQSVLGHARAQTTKDVYAPRPNVAQLLDLEEKIQ